MYEYIPEKNPKKMTGILILLGAAAALMLLLPSVLESLPYKWSFQLVGVGVIAAMIYIVSVYSARSFVYRIRAREDASGVVCGYDLTVTEVNQRSAVTVCRIGLENISAVERVSEGRAAARAQKKNAVNKGYKRFNYVADLGSPVRCVIYACECGENVAVRISADEYLYGILTESISGEKREGKEAEE